MSDSARSACTDSAVQCLVSVVHLHGLSCDWREWVERFGDQLAEPPGLIRAAHMAGLKARQLPPDLDRLSRLRMPAIACDAQGQYLIIAQIRHGEGNLQVLMQRPGQAAQVVPPEYLRQLGVKFFICFKPSRHHRGAPIQSIWQWLWPSLRLQQGCVLKVLVLSGVLQLLALVTPLFFQVVMDKVLINQATLTLHVVVAGLLICLLLEALLGGMRSVTLLRLGSRLDAQWGADVFSHLLRLPAAYFQSRKAGDSLSRLQELDTIRSFVTGSALTSLLDLFFAVLFMMVMLSYSLVLSAVVVGALTGYIILSVLLTPWLRHCLDERARRLADSHAFQVETLSGIQTVKALALEDRWQIRWEHHLAMAVDASWQCARVGLLASGSVNVISRLQSITILALGADAVMQQELTVGQLVAFTMLAGQVSAPVLRIAGTWQEFQQIGLSGRRLADLLRVPGEMSERRSPLPRLKGYVCLDSVYFRYAPDTHDVMQGFSLDIPAGQTVGIVGQSGSGKSTLAQLLLRLRIPQQGRIQIDGFDLASIDIASLRRQIGYVQQDATLVSGTVRDNIALSHADASLESVIAAARLAGAHEFIVQLPMAYETVLGEQGCGLSGGQRQRLAIARALLSNPRILIFDEATSALDIETEIILRQNMRHICRGRTVLIIAHRLSAVMDAHRIIVMQKGRVLEAGSPEELARRPSSQFARMLRQQHHAFAMQDVGADRKSPDVPVSPLDPAGRAGVSVIPFEVSGT